MPAVPTGCWLHEDVEVGPSTIEGQGLFVRRALAAGTRVAVLGGRLVSSDELAALFDQAASTPGAYVDTITVHEGEHLVLSAGTDLHYVNHSCDPNIWHVGPYTLVTRRTVAAGEELTVDYATHSGFPGFRLDCRCGSWLCRRTVTGDDWKRPDLQERYGSHWVPALLNRISAERS